MNDEPTGPEIRPLVRPDHQVRTMLVEAYAEGLRTSPEQAWRAALELARERFPGASEQSRRKMLLLTLGLFDSDARRGQASGQDGYLPCLLPPELWMRLCEAAKDFGVHRDELATRVLSAWINAACDFDGRLLEDTPTSPTRGRPD